MPDRPETHSFTARYDSLSRVLRTQEVGISTIHALAVKKRPAPRTYSAIWDTGATHTNVTTRVVKECGLVPTGVADVTGVHGTQRANIYLINVYLPNRVVVEGVGAVETPSLPEVDDVLIGMDIIGMGDFAVSNFQGRTVFSFRMPSQEEVDFASRPPRVGVPKVGRNDPCPCGSGKKYKKCHGSPLRN